MTFSALARPLPIRRLWGALRAAGVVVVAIGVLVLALMLSTDVGAARRNAPIHYREASPFSFSMPTASTNSVQRAMSFAMNFCTSAGP